MLVILIAFDYHLMSELQCKAFRLWLGQGWADWWQSHVSTRVMGTYGYAAPEWQGKV